MYIWSEFSVLFMESWWLNHYMGNNSHLFNRMFNAFGVFSVLNCKTSKWFVWPHPSLDLDLCTELVEVSISDITSRSTIWGGGTWIGYYKSTFNYNFFIWVLFLCFMVWLVLVFRNFERFEGGIRCHSYIWKGLKKK